jgi:hypothetical protein
MESSSEFYIELSSSIKCCESIEGLTSGGLSSSAELHRVIIIIIIIIINKELN